MRFNKGSKVEVLTKKEVPTGAWRCAEIISGNGHTYSVKYSCFPVTVQAAAVERVPRKALRPCPPPINGTIHWVSGDLVEVFDELCWKPAVIVRVLGGNNFSVKIMGSNSELKAHLFRLRVRQSWEDGNWFVVGKGSSNLNEPLKRKRSSLGFSDVSGQKKCEIERGSIGGKRILLRLPSPASEKNISWSMLEASIPCFKNHITGLSLSPLAVDMMHGLKELLSSYLLVLGRFLPIAQGPGVYVL
ncbi:hypothetical protein REPUB_Repub14bG0036300 [Reevesia pubescens]